MFVLDWSGSHHYSTQQKFSDRFEVIQEMRPEDGLSKRAFDVLHLLAHGLSDKEIADRLSMTVNTVKWYNREIYDIFGVGSRTQAIAYANKHHLLSDINNVRPSLSDIHPVPRNPLPKPPTQFVGRKKDLENIKHLLANSRLLTLSGPPGTGKTRLALQAASEVSKDMRNGICFVPLAPLSEPSLVTHAIANAVGVDGQYDQFLLDRLKRHLRDRRMLLVLDNFEHLLPAALQVSELLTAAPEIKVLATSRERLHLYGEQEYTVSPLGLPDLAHPDVEVFAACESIALFIQQAQAVRSDFALTKANALDIANICIRLEGLPLAIELAAAHITLLTPRTLLNRLTSRMNMLIGGARDLPARQRTLLDTLDWSYNLLNDSEKTLFARLAVFRDWQSLTAIEAICANDLPIDLADGLASLVDKSLIQQNESAAGELGIMMLETIREYARRRLEESDEAQVIHQQHAEYCVKLAERAEQELAHADFSYWMGRLENEDSNFQVALEWSLDGGDVELGLRLVASLRDYWVICGRLLQGQEWTQRALAMSGAVAPGLKARVLMTSGAFLYSSLQQATQKQVLGEAVAIARATNDRLNLAWALAWLGTAFIGEASKYEEAMDIAEQSLLLFQELGNKPGITHTLNLMGELARTAGNDEGAQAAYEKCLEVVREIGEIRREVMLLANLGVIAKHQGDLNRAEQLFKQALMKQIDLGGYAKIGSVGDIVFVAGVIGARGDLERAARLFGAADALFESFEMGLEPGDLPEYERDLAFVRSQLGEDQFQLCLREGRELSLDQAIEVALGR